jgi:hypothetical protein
LVSESLEEGDTNMPLKDVAVRNAKPSAKPRKLSDGGGLHVLIQLTGSKLWRLAYRFGASKKPYLSARIREFLLRKREGGETRRKGFWLPPSILLCNARPTDRRGRTVAFGQSLKR